MPKANKIDVTWRSAVARKEPSKPAQWLVARSKVYCSSATLDYGCGKGLDADSYRWDRYDPHFFPELPRRQYAFIVCIYVLNILAPKKRKELIEKIRGLLLPAGVAYFAVRRDVGIFRGKPAGYKQYNVKLPFPAIREDSQYCLYEVRK